VTYHNYYKAPDLLGPEVSAALGLPYILIEASRAKKRLTGPWARFAARAEAASDAARVVFYPTRHDHFALDRDRPEGQQLCWLAPFLRASALPAPASPDIGTRILAVGMLRSRDKLASYEVIARTLAQLRTPDWSLDIAGDGPARSEVAALMAPFGPRVRFLGALDPATLQAAYRAASVFFWPGVNEAYGMVYLEAQAAGLPALAQDRPGVRDLLHSGPGVPVDAGPAGLAAALDQLLSDPELRRRRGAKARQAVAAHHLLPAAQKTLATALTDIWQVHS